MTYKGTDWIDYDRKTHLARQGRAVRAEQRHTDRQPAGGIALKGTSR